MKLLYIMLVAVIVIPACANAQGPANFISGKVEFKIKNMGLTVDGTMNIRDLFFKQPTADPSTWTLSGSASPATIETGIGIRDKHLKKSDYFDIEKHPLIQMQSTGIKPKSKNNYEGTFTLTVKGISKTVSIPLSIVNNGNLNQVEGEFTINRLQFGLGEKSSILADYVKIKVTGVFPSVHKN